VRHVPPFYLGHPQNDTRSFKPLFCEVLDNLRMELQRQSVIIGAPSALGQELPGVETAPDALRKTGLAEKITALGFRVDDAGNVDIPSGVATRKAVGVNRSNLIHIQRRNYSTTRRIFLFFILK